MTAESIYDILPEDCNSNWDEHLEYGLHERTSRSQHETIDDPSPLELKRIRETSSNRNDKGDREIFEIRSSPWQSARAHRTRDRDRRFCKGGLARNSFKIHRRNEEKRFQEFPLSTRSIFGEESTFHPLELQGQKKSLLQLTLPVPCRMKFSLRYLPNWTDKIVFRMWVDLDRVRLFLGKSL